MEPSICATVYLLHSSVLFQVGTGCEYWEVGSVAPSWRLVALRDIRTLLASKDCQGSLPSHQAPGRLQFILPIVHSTLLPQHLHLEIQEPAHTDTSNTDLLDSCVPPSPISGSGNSCLPATWAKMWLIPSSLSSWSCLPCPIYQQILLNLPSKYIWNPPTSPCSPDTSGLSPIMFCLVM